MTPADLVSIVTGASTSSSSLFSIPPRSPAGCGIGGLLNEMQSEWDAAALEIFTLRKSLQKTKAELAHLLYTHDGACRVISRLVKERDSLRDQLAQSIASGAVRRDIPSEEGTAEKRARPTDSEEGDKKMPKLISDICEAQKVLLAGRKAKKGSAPSREAADLEKLTARCSADISFTPALLDVSASNKWIFAEGSGSLQACSVEGDFVSLTAQKQLKGAKATCIVAHPQNDELCAFGTDSGAVCLWNCTKKGAKPYSQIVSGLGSSVLSVSFHPQSLALYTATNDSWCLVDAQSGEIVQKCPCENILYGAMHPDGILYGATSGDSNVVRFWDLRKGKEPCISMIGESSEPATVLTFSENGYNAALGTAEGLLTLWDLRKGPSCTAKIEINGSGPLVGAAFEDTGAKIVAAKRKQGATELVYIKDKVHKVLGKEVDGSWNPVFAKESKTPVLVSSEGGNIVVYA